MMASRGPQREQRFKKGERKIQLRKSEKEWAKRHSERCVASRKRREKEEIESAENQGTI